jgi:hypothetical protein
MEPKELIALAASLARPFTRSAECSSGTVAVALVTVDSLGSASTNREAGLKFLFRDFVNSKLSRGKPVILLASAMAATGLSSMATAFTSGSPFSAGFVVVFKTRVRAEGWHSANMFR